MPEFLDSYIRELSSKSERIKEEYEYKSSKLASELKRAFEKFWIDFNLPNHSPSEFPVMAIDSSSAHLVTSNGGIFYVVRATALSKGGKYKDIVADFDFTADSTYDAARLIHRKMEWLEHKVALKAIMDGFDGFLLFDGSIYGRLAHIPIETGYVNDRDFMLRYFETVIELLDTCRRKGIPIVGVSKESRTAFFREFLVKSIFDKIKDELKIEKPERLLSLALDNKKRAIEELEKLEGTSEVGILRELMEELLARKPDFQLILAYASSAGYTTPLKLGATLRWRRSYNSMIRDPKDFVKSNFPVASREEDFIDWAVKVVKKILELPSIVSFHILPALNDTPMRIDVPVWVFGLDDKLSEVGWPEPAEVDIGDILNILAAGYCGLDNYNIWLKAVDDEVKLRREVF
ncbi:hypothetical protein DRP07_09420, partial [Archaeoglobales archaeon]